jgi:hypothetical protein
VKLPDPKLLKWFDEVDKPPPTHEEHGVEDTWEHPLSEKLVKAKCWNWQLRGNLLTCDTDFGPLAQTIPTGYILTGEKNGLPEFKKIA